MTERSRAREPKTRIAELEEQQRSLAAELDSRSATNHGHLASWGGQGKPIGGQRYAVNQETEAGNRTLGER